MRGAIGIRAVIERVSIAVSFGFRDAVTAKTDHRRRR
jgi:hypothetical protein